MSQIDDFLNDTPSQPNSGGSRSDIDSFLSDAPKRKRSLLETANDLVIEGANAAAGGLTAAANFVAPGNRVSQFIEDKFIKAGEEKQSDVVRGAKRELSEGIEQADGVMGELGAVGKYIAQNPLLATSQALGSFALPGAAVKGAGALATGLGAGARGATLAGQAGGVAAGTAMAGGDAAGTAYELSKNAGATEEQAQAAARQASIIPAAVGGITGAFGAERILAGGRGFSGGMVSRGLKTGLSEAAQEALEEGVTQFEGQRAAMPFDETIDPTKGVAAAAGLGAALGFIPGAAIGAMSAAGDQPARQPLVNVAGLQREPVQEVPEMAPVKPSEAMGLDPAAGPLSAAAAQAVDAGASAVVQPVPAQPMAPQPAAPLAAAVRQADAQPAPDLAARTTEELRAALRNAQDPNIRKAVAAELSKRKREEAAAMPDPLQTSERGFEFSAVDESFDGAAVNAKLFRDLSDASAIKKQWLDVVNPELDLAVQRNMLRIAQNPEILNAVVELIPVNVVDMLRRRQLTPEMVFNNPSVLKSSLIRGNSNDSIAIPVDGAAAIMRAVAMVAAKNKAVDQIAHSGGLSVNGNAAANTGVPTAITPEFVDNGGQTGAPLFGDSTSKVGSAGGVAKDVRGANDLGFVSRNDGSALMAIGGNQNRSPSIASILNQAQQKSQKEPQEPAASQTRKGQPLTDTGTNMLGRGADPLQSIIQGENDARRVAEGLRGDDGTGAGAGVDNADASVAPDMGAVRGRGTDATDAQPAAQGDAGQRPAGTADSASSLRPDGWRKNALKAGRVARGLGLNPKGKRLAEIVAEIDAVDAGTDVQNAPQGTAGEAQATAVEAPEAARSDDAAAAGVPAARGAGEAQADGLSNTVEWNGKQMPMAEAQAGLETFRAMVADTAKTVEELERSKKKGDPTRARAMREKLESRRELVRRMEQAIANAESAAQSQPKTEPQPKPSNDAGSVSQRPQEPQDAVQEQGKEAAEAVSAEVAQPDSESIVVKEGKGLIKGKYLVEVDGDGAPGGPWDTPEQAMLAGEEWKKKTIQNAKDTKQERERWDAIAENFKAGKEVTTAQIESLGLKAGTSDVRWFFPIAARLFNITSRDIRPIVKDLIRDSLTDMGAKREFVPTRKALEAVAADVVLQEKKAEATIKPSEMYRRLQQLSARANRKPYTPLTDDEFKAVVDAGLATGKKWATGKLNTEGYGRLAQLEADETESSNARADAEDLIAEKLPFKASAVDQYGLDVPDGYVRQGSMFVRDSAQQEDQQPTQAEQKGEGESAASKIEDLGEKIGGARKDTATAVGKRGQKKVDDERPAWARRYQIAQVADIEGLKDAGRWVIRDTKNLDWNKQPRLATRDSFDTQEAAEAMLPVIAVGRNHRAVPTRDGKYEIWRDINDRKRVKIVDKTFDTREDALRHMLDNAVEIIEANTTFGEADLPKPPNTQRVGVARRTGNVQGPDFMETFGFRGVEFGNWNNQEERQEIMNEAFDGLLDLAEVMGIPPKAISMNGELALAFGARGHGLSGARAHYEPEKAVINLTKMNGAGALAHEWFHAMDHYFGRQDGKASSKWEAKKDGTRSLPAASEFERDAVTSGFGRNSGVRAEVRAAYDELMKTIFSKAEKYVEDTEKADKFVATLRKEVQSQLDSIRKDLAEQRDTRYYKTKNKPASAEQLAEFDTVAQQILDGTATDVRYMSIPGSKSLTGGRWSNDALEKISAIYKDVRGRSGFDSTNQRGFMDRLRGTMSNYAARLKMLADAQEGSEKTKKVPTEFAMDAKSLDQGRGKDYWTTPHEMGARAFQGYVEDKIAEMGGRSPFLNYGPENAGILTPWGVSRPYPAGAERKAINAAIDKLVNTIQTRETDGGNVEMFSIADEAPPFYSALAREIGKSPMKQGFAPAWNQYLDALAKRGAIKADEVEWTGLREWLNLQDGKVTKDQIAEYLDANGVQVTETVLGGSEPQVITSDEALDRLRNNLPVGWRRGDQVVQMHSPDSIVDDRSYYRELVDDGEAEWIDTGTNVGGEVTQTKYGNYTLPGGTNYREVLLTLPMRSADAPKGEVKYDPAGDAAYPWAIIVNGKEVNRSSDEATAPDILQEEIDRATKKAGYRSSHWDQKNVLAHIRVNDRTDADGKRVLFVEEIQSDWGQDGKKKGFAGQEQPGEVFQQSNGDWGVRWADGTVSGGFTREGAERVAPKGKSGGGVPLAPFVDKTDKWLALSLKRIVKMAVDGGYDRVAFVNGEQSADRYDLSKQISKVEYLPQTKVLRAFDMNGQGVFDRQAEPEQLEDFIGKDVAKKLLESTPYTTGSGKQVHRLEGVDLKVGGEGMKAFYDKIVPAAVKDVLKKVGGGQMETVEIGITKGEKSEYSFGPFKAEDARIIERAPGVFQVWVKNPSNNVDQVRGGNFKTRAAAEQFIADMAPGQAQPGFTITPQMREKVAGGLPLFKMADQQVAKNLSEQHNAPSGMHAQAVKAFADRLNKQRARPVEMEAVSPGTGERGKMAKTIQGVARKLFNRDVVFVRFTNGDPLFNGAVSQAAPGKVFINIDSQRPMMAVLGHELLHELRKSDEGAYQALRTRLDALLADKSHPIYANILAVKYEKAGMKSLPRDIAEELYADIVGDHFTEPQFWQALTETSKEKPLVWKRLLNAVARWLESIGKKLGRIKSTNDGDVMLTVAQQADGKRPFGTGAFLTDVEASRQAVLDAIKGFDGRQAKGADALSVSDRTPQTETAAFKKWFGDSKVVDANGKPLVVYHGTRGDVGEFAPDKVKGRFPNSEGFYFTSRPSHASVYADSIDNAVNNFDPASPFAKPVADGANVMPAYVSIQNPKIITVSEWGTLESAVDGDGGASVRAAREAGHDGVIVKRRAGDEYDGDLVIAFRPEQIKSAAGNRGTFDPDNADIRFSIADARDNLSQVMPQKVMDLYADATTSQRGFNRWWHRTVGTQLHKAKINKEFGRVFYSVQDFMRDVSRMATIAADKAPTLLTQIESLSDVGKAVPLLTNPARMKERKANLKAASDALFDGTLKFTRDANGKPVEAMDAQDAGIVWTNAELKERGLSPEAIKMYREGRAAIDQSLDNMLAADIYRVITTMDPEMLVKSPSEWERFADRVRKMAASEKPMDAVDATIEAMRERAEELENEVNTLRNMADQAEGDEALFLNAAATEPQTKLDGLREEIKKVSDKRSRINALKKAGYAPLMRFGEYAVSAYDEAGQRVFFGLYESQFAANRAARKFNEQGLRTDKSVMSKQEFEQLKGLSPETAMLFAEMLGVEKNEAMQTWLKNAVAEQSALKRHIRRKGVSGFDDDSSRVVAAFLTSNSRAASRALHSYRIEEAVANVRQGDVKDEAIKLADYVNNPKEEAQAIRTLLFVNYIGGSVSSALVNLTQTFVQTYPFLSQYGGAVKAGQRVSSAMRMAMSKNIANKEIAEAVKQAENDGVIKPQEVFQLQAEASRTMGSNLYARTGLALWGSFFQLAEVYNRRVAFIAAYQTAKQEGIRNPFAFAENAVNETQGVFNKGNRPNWSRGAIGATLFTFKTFTIQYVEFLKRMPPKQRAVALGVLFLMAGAGGFPFAEDAEDLIDTVAQGLGYNFTSKSARDEFLRSTLGDGWATFIQSGVSPWTPFDVSQRLGMADLLPGTGILKKSETRKEDQALEIFGVAGSFVRDALKGEVRPIAFRNAAKAIEMYDMGVYRDTRGRKVMDVEPLDAILKSIGLQPAGVAAESRKIGMQYEKRALYEKVRNEITEQMALGHYESDPQKVERARQAAMQWNEKNPEAPMFINMQNVWRRVREMNLDRTDRFLKSAPKELRGQIQQAIQ